ncbi:molybdopterin molybdotransferase MoeA [Natronomonas gomsonensis]|uniref:molybdopterin molybdotransferase MoeA n=1 Tax=Natronomonas gomsonensis TaxID=1046043 RepID=UPI0020CA60F7|nr:molybdopterin molybdotransferase MoeA [Natronomonas gomsonensis]MCY4729992.1 molybdopterin molybdotransferase MoeA [Natronomonas gomsonensis]
MGHEHEDMVWRSAAVETVLKLRRSALTRTESEPVGIGDISGRVLATSIVAEQDIPATDYATMDGYAVNASDEYPLSIVDEEVFPEDEPPSLDDGQTVEIATGAPLPEAANAVLKREESTVEDGQLDGPRIEPGTYTYARGSNVRAGERLFEAGERLSAKDAILLGDLGYDEVSVAERFSVGILATGTEIHEGRRDDLDSAMLAALVRSWGHEPTYEGTVPDDYEAVEAAIADLADGHDVVLTTGGTSVGHKDYVIRALANLGTVHFHRVRVRPGKPIAAATVGEKENTVAFAIPGKPLGAHTITTLVARPFFTGSSFLPTVDATMGSAVDLGPEGFEYAVPVVFDGDTAVPLGHADSRLHVYNHQFDPSVLSSTTRATRADGFILTESSLSAGETVSVVPYPVLE